jgi:hypothetical protein
VWIVSQTVVMFVWLVGTGFGALWTSSFERGASQSARLYGFCMAYSYFAALALGVLGGPGVRPRWLALGFLLVVLGLIAMIIVGRRLLRRHRAAGRGPDT